jgi:hypothetical protein
MLLTGDDNSEGSNQEYLFEIFQHAEEFLRTNGLDGPSQFWREGAQDGQEDCEGASVDGSTLRK